MIRLISIAMGVIITSTTLVGCSQAPETTKPSEPFAGAAELSRYYEQTPEWVACGDQLYCSEIAVPLDWSDPERQEITIGAIYRQADDGQDSPFLLFNPGGPGASGYSWLEDSSEYLGTSRLRKHFNILGFDPRGVGRSTPVKCLEDFEYDDFLYGVSGFELGSPDDLEASRAAIKDFIDSCVKNTGEVLGYVDTVSAARDMDILRAVVGEQKLNYLGYSYGTFLGSTYATLYPERVGRLVLDGAIDPTVPDAEQTRFQIAAFEKSLEAYVADCLKSSECPFDGTVSSSMKKVGTLLENLESKPLPTESGRKLTIWAAVTGLIMPLYSESYWSLLTEAFEGAFSGDGTMFLYLADLYNERSEDGSYSSNIIPANTAINCLDARQPADMESMQVENQKMLQAAPTIGKYWQFGALSCEQWPYPVSERPDSYDAEGSAPIMVVGTTGDPATPYSQAVSLANKILDNAFLLTYNGEGHTAYGQGISCVDNNVDDYLIDGTIPKSDPDC